MHSMKQALGCGALLDTFVLHIRYLIRVCPQSLVLHIRYLIRVGQCLKVVIFLFYFFDLKFFNFMNQELVTKVMVDVNVG